MNQANDMEEKMDRLALYKIRARKKARAQELAEGRIERRVEGRVEGRDNERTATALDMRADNKPIDEIVKYSHLSKETVLELQKKSG